MTVARPLFACLLLTALACSKPAEEAAPAAEAEHAAEPEGNGIVRTPAPAGAKVFFKTPADGAEVTSPVTIEFGIEGMDVVRAGVEQEHSGHHHLIIDADLPALDGPIPADDHYVHFGDASTSTTRELPVGRHRLQLLLGDHRHIPHEPAVTSDVIHITVVETTAEGDTAEGEDAPTEATE